MPTKSGSPAKVPVPAPVNVPSKGLWSYVSNYAARVFFLLIILQVPLFRITCRSGTCSTPLHVTASQLIASGTFPLPVVKALLYPGATVNGLVHNFTVPRWDDLLAIYNLTAVKEASAVPDLQRLEVLAGSYFSIAGALIGLLKPGRMSMFGTLVIVWGLVKEGILTKSDVPDPNKTIYVYPTMLIAVICAFMSVKYDMKKVSRIPPRPIATPLKRSSKSKLR